MHLQIHSYIAQERYAKTASHLIYFGLQHGLAVFLGVLRGGRGGRGRGRVIVVGEEVGHVEADATRTDDCDALSRHAAALQNIDIASNLDAYMYG